MPLWMASCEWLAEIFIFLRYNYKETIDDVNIYKLCCRNEVLISDFYSSMFIVVGRESKITYTSGRLRRSLKS